jgi:hypothetical protein
MSSVMFKKHLHQHLLLGVLIFYNIHGAASEMVHTLFAMNEKMCINDLKINRHGL